MSHYDDRRRGDGRRDSGGQMDRRSSYGGPSGGRRDDPPQRGAGGNESKFYALTPGTHNFVANYFEVTFAPKTEYHQYKVTFQTGEDKKQIYSTKTAKLLVKHSSPFTGGAPFLLSGRPSSTTDNYNDIYWNVYVVHPIAMTGNTFSEPVTIVSAKSGRTLEASINFEKIRSFPAGDDDSAIQFVNSLARQAMRLLGYERIGRNMFNLNNKVRIQGHPELEYLHGIQTSILKHCKGTHLVIDLATRLLHTRTIYEQHKSGSLEYDDLEGCIVLTNYNQLHKTHRIVRAHTKDNLFEQTFIWKQRIEGKAQEIKVTVGDYFETRYGIRFTREQKNSFLLVARQKDRRNKNLETEYFIPACLAYFTGKTRKFRSDHRAQKDVAGDLVPVPNERVNRLRNVIESFMKPNRDVRAGDEYISNRSTVMDEFNSMGVQVSQNPVTVEGTVFKKPLLVVSSLSGEAITIGNERKYFNPFPPLEDPSGVWGRKSEDLQRSRKIWSVQGDWVSQVKDFPSVARQNSAKLLSWRLIYSAGDADRAKMLNEKLAYVARQRKCDLQELSEHELRDGHVPLDRRPSPKDVTALYSQRITELVQRIPKLKTNGFIVVLLPNRDEKTYKDLKRTCYVEVGILSQFVVADKMDPAKPPLNIITNVCLQIIAKTGGVVHYTPILDRQFDSDTNEIMLIGCDSSHEAATKKASVSAFVSSFDKELCQYYTQLRRQKPGQDQIIDIQERMKKALQKFYAMNKAFPKMTILYRDGVGEGDIEKIREQELSKVLAAFEEVKASPRLIYILCMKRISTKLLYRKDGNYFNVPPGSWVGPNKEISRELTPLEDKGRYRNFDFFLVSQEVRQGCAQPTHYRVIYNSLYKGTLQGCSEALCEATYRSCNIFAGFSGPVAHPAPVKYAHKASEFACTKLEGDDLPHKDLEDHLYYL